MSDRGCSHLDAIAAIKQPERRECEECIKIGAYWVHLRTCQTCGVTLCCDSSPNRHASKHARVTGHPVIVSAQPGERWLYCYPDDAFAEYQDWRFPYVNLASGPAEERRIADHHRLQNPQLNYDCGAR